MGQFDVHLFSVVRVKIEGINAQSMPEAIEKAHGRIDLYAHFNREKPVTEWAEEISHYLVDARREGEPYDDTVDDSRWFADDGTTVLAQGYPEITIKLINGQLHQVYVPRGLHAVVSNARDRADDGSISDVSTLDRGVYTFENGKQRPEGEESSEHMVVSQNDARELMSMLDDMCDFLMESHHDEVDSDHYGDDSCSYCEAIEKARALISKYRVAA